MKVIGIDNDGCLICDDNGYIYNCGETLEEYGTHNLNTEEKKALGIYDQS